MRKIIKVGFILGLILILFFIVIYIWFIIGMTNASRARSIDTVSSKTYKTNILNEFSDINNVKIYYRFGRIFFDFTVSPGMTLDEYKKVVKETKDFIQKEGVTSLLPNGYDQLSIRIEFNNKKGQITFESPYWIPTEDTTDNPNNTVENNYKVWYMNRNNEPETKIDF